MDEAMNDEGMYRKTLCIRLLPRDRELAEKLAVKYGFTTKAGKPLLGELIEWLINECE